MSQPTLPIQSEQAASMRYQDKYTYVLLLLFAAGIMLVVSKSSPLYVINDWVDLNAFLTMGKGWAHGLVPYRDLFEQKGPVLYILFLLAHQIANSYLGVFIIETLFFFLTLVILFKTARFFLSSRMSLVLCFISAIFLTLSPFFKAGGSAEELAFPAIVYTIYLVFKLQAQAFKLSKMSYLLSGVSLGCLFWAKYTMIGSWVGFFLSLAVCLLIQKELKELLGAVTYSLLGFSLVSFAVLAYFYATGALGDLYHAYFYANIALYPPEGASSVAGKLINAIVIYVSYLKDYPLLFAALLGGPFIALFDKQIFRTNGVLFMYLSSYFLLIATTFFGGKFYEYYFLVLCPFACLPLLSVLVRLDRQPVTRLRLLLTSVTCLLFSMGMNGNIVFSKLFPDNPSISLDGSASEPAQLRFAKLIRQEDNPTLLNYGQLDMGLYQAADVLPVNYFFEKQNIPDSRLPQMMAEQNRLVDEKQVMFVVVRTLQGKSETEIPEHIRRNYDLIAVHDQFFEQDRTYWLYKVKPD